MDDTSASLTAQLNKASRKIHKISNGLVNAKLVALFGDTVLYGKALACFYYVFAALEKALDEARNGNDTDVVKFQGPLKGGLYRAAGFRKDLEFFLGPDWEAQYGAKSTALKEYEHHLALLASTQPRLLLAHAFTQHLAAASGGQMIKRWARNHFQLPEDRGTAAFDFQGESNNSLRSRFKSQMDEWGKGLNADEVQQLTDEHIAAFQYNNGIIRAFPVPAAAVLRGLFRVLPRWLLLLVVALLVLALALIVPLVAKTGS